MLQPGMTFGSEGPLVQGTWVNPITGDSFTVRDSFFEDNNYVITTTDGRYIRYEQFQNYVQADEKSVAEIKNNLKNKQQDEPIPAEISGLIDTDDTDSSMLTPEDAAMIYGNKPVSLGNLNNIKAPLQESKAIQEENMNSAIIKKALSSTETPKFKINLKWDNYPAKQIEMLYDIMGISEEEIVEWYLNNIQMIDIIDTIKESIKNKIVAFKPKEEIIIQEPVTNIEKLASTKKKVSKTSKSKKV